HDPLSPLPGARLPGYGGGMGRRLHPWEAVPRTPVVVVPAPPAAAVRAPTGAETRSTLKALSGSLSEVHRLAGSKEWKALAGPVQRVLDTPGLPDVVARPVRAIKEHGEACEALHPFLATLVAGRRAEGGPVLPLLTKDGQAKLKALLSLEELESLLS